MPRAPSPDCVIDYGLRMKGVVVVGVIPAQRFVEYITFLVCVRHIG